MTITYCDVCGDMIRDAPRTIKLGQAKELDVCDKCLESAEIHFEVLRKLKRGLAHREALIGEQAKGDGQE